MLNFLVSEGGILSQEIILKISFCLPNVNLFIIPVSLADFSKIAVLLHPLISEKYLV